MAPNSIEGPGSLEGPGPGPEAEFDASDPAAESILEIPVAVVREPSGISWPPRTGGLAPNRYTVLNNPLDSWPL